VASGQPAGWPAAFDRLAPVVFPLPAVLFIVALLAFPVVYTVWMSLQDWFISGVQQPTFVGLENYRKLLLEDQRFLEAVLRTVQFTALAVAAETVLGIGAALVFAKEFWGRGFWRTLYILPMVATPVAIALIFVMLFHPSLGVLNWFLTTLGLPPSRWTYARETVIPALVLVDIWQWTPLVMLIVLGGLAAPAGAVRVGGDRRRLRLADVLVPHAAAPPPDDRRGDAVPLDRRAQDLRHHLRHDPGRAGHGIADDQHLPVRRRVPVLPDGLRLGDRRAVLHPDPRLLAAADPGAAGVLGLRRPGEGWRLQGERGAAVQRRPDGKGWCR
jgi:hypothetical protein